MNDCIALKALQKQDKGVLAMHINSTLDGTELEGGHDTSGHEEVNSHDDINWMENKGVRALNFKSQADNLLYGIHGCRSSSGRLR